MGSEADRPEKMEPRARDFSYTTDQVASLLHKRKIDAGGYGDVHEASPQYQTANK